MPALIAAALAVGAPCPVEAFEMAIVSRPIDPALIGAVQDPTNSKQFSVGAFSYRGQGLVVRSADSRFRDLRIGQATGLTHRCGNAVWGPSGWNATDPDLSRWMLHVRQPAPAASVGSGVSAAAVRRVRPTLTGYVVGPTWPVYGAETYFLGLMYPATQTRKETAVVAFADTPGDQPAIVLARLPLRLTTLNVIPDIHGPEQFIDLSGLDRKKLVTIVLRLEPETSKTIGARLAQSR